MWSQTVLHFQLFSTLPSLGGKRGVGCYYRHLPWQLLRPLMRADLSSARDSGSVGSEAVYFGALQPLPLQRVCVGPSRAPGLPRGGFRRHRQAARRHGPDPPPPVLGQARASGPPRAFVHVGGGDGGHAAGRRRTDRGPDQGRRGSVARQRPPQMAAPAPRGGAGALPRRRKALQASGPGRDKLPCRRDQLAGRLCRHRAGAPGSGACSDRWAFTGSRGAVTGSAPPPFHSPAPSPGAARCTSPKRGSRPQRRGRVAHGATRPGGPARRHAPRLGGDPHAAAVPATRMPSASQAGLPRLAGLRPPPAPARASLYAVSSPPPGCQHNGGGGGRRSSPGRPLAAPLVVGTAARKL